MIEIGDSCHRDETLSGKSGKRFEVGARRADNGFMGLFTRRHKAAQLRSNREFETLLNEGKPILIDFYKYGCQPCQVMDGIVDEVSEEFSEEAVVMKANLETVPDLFGRFKVRSTPTFVLVTPSGDGLHQRWRHSGLVKKNVIVDNLKRAVAKT